MREEKQTSFLPISKLLLFFIPLGLSASLVTFSHIIINGTLARGEEAEVIISSYVIAMSLFAITERLGVLLRHTCSALVRDKVSFKAVLHVATYVLLVLMFIATTIAYTPIGKWIFTYFFGAESAMVSQIIEVYQILIIVTFFSAIRCLFQGVIILERQTKWLTIGMIIRLIVMYLLSLYFIKGGNITAVTGAYIFLAGMMVESLVSYLEGRLLVKKLKEKQANHTVTTKKQVFRFYSPLIWSSLIIVMVGPFINAFLGKTNEIELAIASYALALSVTQLILSFFTYVHQIVLSFYNENSKKVIQFTSVIGIIPAIVLAIICFTPLGPLFLETVLGANERLVEASMDCLHVFLIMTIVFPCIDFCNGILLIREQTKAMLITQSTNLLITFLILLVGSSLVPNWNGVIGALAQSVGMVGELAVLLFIVLKGGATLHQQKKRKEKEQSIGL
ncbi:multi antimicrobial extrusion protein MatE [Halalkalibacter urbisdiaboli]|uniref:multi antimicrobial extrusion protein MatE n=1 Tax=Halalkalibacter urbisdiaboli TaxID=1960589 RepID=UPI001A99BB0C|nr:multi antimicrobial extrusion protein MatE [Halalkalibacter urbisdiaboli]